MPPRFSSGPGAADAHHLIITLCCCLLRAPLCRPGRRPQQVRGLPQCKTGWHSTSITFQECDSTFPPRGFLAGPQLLVYSAHENGPDSFSQARFKAHDFIRSLPLVWRQCWAHVQQEALAPVMLGKFGGLSVVADPGEQSQRASSISYRVRYQQHLVVKDAELGGHGGLLEHDW